MENKTYALVENGEIVLYPLTIEEISLRNAPYEDYLECYYAPVASRPTPSLSEKVVETPLNLGIVIYIQEKIEKKTIAEMFTYLQQTAVAFDENNQPYIDRTTISAELFMAFLDVTKVHVQTLLDTFARTRGYDDLRSVCTYVSSTNPVYQAEAVRAVYLRDLTWSTLYTRFTGIMAGTYPVPSSWEDVAQELPALVWEEA